MFDIGDPMCDWSAAEAGLVREYAAADSGGYRLGDRCADEATYCG